MRILFIFTLCSERVPAISLVGSVGGILTIGAAPAIGLGGIGSMGGRDTAGALGTGGAGGGVLGMGAAAAGAATGGGGGGAAAATGSGAAAAAGLAAGSPPAPILILRSLVPGVIVEPSSTRSSSMTPATDDGTGTLVLSVSTSQTTSSTATESPTCFSHLISPSLMESAKGGHSIIWTPSPSILVVWKLLLGTNKTRNSWADRGFSFSANRALEQTPVFL